MEPTTQASGWFDSFTGALSQYYQFRTAEQVADASGAAQAAQANTVPVQTATPESTNVLDGMNAQKLMMGGLLLLGVVFIAKKL